MTFFLFKTLHIIGFVSWFAGLFYIGRMFVYHAEALSKTEPLKSILSGQLEIMQRRVYAIIMNPAMMITWACGMTMLYLNGWEWWKLNLWMHFKLGLLLLLTIYHISCKMVIKKLATGQMPMSSFKFRLFNEVPTLFLILISSLAVYKNKTNALYLFLTLIGIIALLVSLTILYKKYRLKNEKS